MFDLDLTLVDSAIAEQARSRRDRQRVYSLIPQLKLYSRTEDVFQLVRMNRHRLVVALACTAPSSYVGRVVNYFNYPVDTFIGYHYHDAPRKPSPAGMIPARQRMGTTTDNTVSFGDGLIDILSSNAADIHSVVYLWGTKEEGLFRSSSATSFAASPSEILKYL